jgi:hypothetical protein
MARALKKVADDVVVGTKARVAILRLGTDEREVFGFLERCRIL